MQHANIELIFYEDLPLASLPLKEYERKGSATLIGSFYSTIEAKVSADAEIGKSTPEPLISKPDETGELLIRASFLPNRQTLDDLLKEDSLAPTETNGDWYSTGVLGYFDEQSRFWLIERTGK
jgi:hypothetical protein